MIPSANQLVIRKVAYYQSMIMIFLVDILHNMTSQMRSFVKIHASYL